MNVLSQDLDYEKLGGLWELQFTTATDVLPILETERVLSGPLNLPSPVQVGKIYQRWGAPNHANGKADTRSAALPGVKGTGFPLRWAWHPAQMHVSPSSHNRFRRLPHCRFTSPVDGAGKVDNVIKVRMLLSMIEPVAGLWCSMRWGRATHTAACRRSQLHGLMPRVLSSNPALTCCLTSAAQHTIPAPRQGWRDHHSGGKVGSSVNMGMAWTSLLFALSFELPHCSSSWWCADRP